MFKVFIVQGFICEELSIVGFVLIGQCGVYDCFCGWFVWLICDVFGQIIGFGVCKFFDDDQGLKYFNILEMLIYKKVQVFYGFDFVKCDIV